ncbi:glutamate racemase [Sulfurimonas sp. C5]|uniref:glutamate racemase n=1 Tax=Sulfurimonas sp. C5 TaxID=3036947 RepID=UPI00245782FD|nr:glutamate racemase [Sulfurimonas sp. C5]MDH4944979.1 glutamate racemase [Sulfurimonas sp. C5]
MRIGVFDSGIGGLTVVKSLLKHQLFEEIVYYGDTARVPYGSKDKNTIIRYGIEAVEMFKNFDLDMIVVACNTVSAYALKEMNETASCPVIGVVEAGVLACANMLDNKDANVLVLGTKATINSQAYENGLTQHSYTNIKSLATPLFVPIVEEELNNSTILDETMKHYFKNVSKPDAVILGCTHFPLIADELQNYFGGETKLVHSGDAIVEYLHTQFDLSKKYPTPTLKFFASENPEALRSIANKWLEL